MSATVGPAGDRPPADGRRHFHWNIWVVLTALGWLAFSALTLSLPYIQIEWLEYVAPWASIVIGMLLLLSILLAAERPNWPVPVRIGMFVGGAGLIFAAYLLQINSALVKPFVALGLMAVSIPVGYWIGDRMEKVTNLIPLAIAMSLADIFSLFQGPTKKIAEDLTAHYEKVAAVQAKGGVEATQALEQLRAPLADFIIVHIPMAGHGMTSPVLGIGDFVVMAFLFRAAWVHHLSPRLVYSSAAFSIIAALFCTQVLNMALPALPFIAIGTISVLWLSQPRMRRLDRQEVMLSFAVIAIFSALIIAKKLGAFVGQ